MSQNEFGTVGSYWNYGHDPHDGNGFGWDKIVITKDTLVNGKIFKKLRRTYYREQTLPPLIQFGGTYFFGLMQIENDSVFINDKLVFDFGVEAGDTIQVFAGFDADWEIGLAVDSITIISIDSHDYKKYYGNKLCLGSEDPYEEFEAIETIGPTGQDFFSWNTDGCILGGGTAFFGCHKNGDFVYPGGSDCEELLLATSDQDRKNAIEMYPNPAFERIILSHSELIQDITILNLNGSVIHQFTKNSKKIELDINSLKAGIYLIEAKSRGKTFINKFVKM